MSSLSNSPVAYLGIYPVDIPVFLNVFCLSHYSFTLKKLNMLVEYINTGDSLKESGVTTNINQRVKYTSNTQSTACTATGTIYTLITGASNGSLIKTITVKAPGNTTKGKIFIYSDVGGGNYTLVDEIAIDAVVKSSICPAFEVSYEVNYYVQPSATLIAWLGNAESFMITVEALDASY